jgi:hypothetical protein
MAASSHSRRVGNWIVMVTETEFLPLPAFSWTHVKAEQGRLWLCCVRIKLEQDSKGADVSSSCRRASLEPSTTTSEHDGTVEGVPAAPHGFGKAHGRVEVDTLEWVAGSPIDHLSVSDFAPMAIGKARAAGNCVGPGAVGMVVNVETRAVVRDSGYPHSGLYIHPLYILVSKIFSSILKSSALIHPLYHPLSTLFTVGLTYHFI